MDDILSINRAIMFGTFTSVELDSIVSAVLVRRAALAKQAKYTLKPGSSVKFYSQKRNCTITGKLEKMATKYATVITPTNRWRVPASMLEEA